MKRSPPRATLDSAGEENPQPQRVGIVVLGMHRSGTSALARVVSLLGAALPRNVLGTHPSNLAGHWEPALLYTLHDRLLAEAGSRWDDWRSFDPSVLGPERLAYYTDELRRTIRDEYGEAPVLILKEPRICRFVPLYEEVLGSLGIEPRFLLVDRNPLAVINSLARRDGMTSGFAGLLWLRHELDAEQATRGKPRAFLSYEALMSDWRATITRVTKALQLDWPRGLDEAGPEIDAHLARDLQHHRPTFADLAADGAVPAWIKESYTALQALARGEGASGDAEATLTRVRDEFEAAAAIFGNAALPEIAAREVKFAAELRPAIVELERRVDLEQGIAAMSAECTALLERLRESTREAAALRHQLGYVIHSKSWRLTAPLRAARHKLRAVQRLVAPRDALLTPTAGHEHFLAEYISAGSDPKVSVIVPNYNHARFLPRRLDSILQQTYSNIEILVLDDCSTDESRDVIERYRRQHPARIRTLFNDQPSGNVFRQWRKGIENTDGALIWICESDDHCELDFLDNLVPYFRDRSVNLAFGQIQFTDQDGNYRDGLDHYREGAEPGIWDQPLVRPAQVWFANGFSVNNLIANVGGCLWRRPALPAAVWSEAETYAVLGDWFLHTHVAGGGKIAWEPRAKAYFRQHGTNKSVVSFTEASYYKEHERLMLFLRSRWDVPDETVERFHQKVARQYQQHQLAERLGPLERYVDKERLLAETRSRPHILMAFLGFHLGGGEIFPINLANALHDAGHLVSMLALDTTRVNEGMMDLLNPTIPVYDAAWVEKYGADRFLTDAGVSLIHSHMVRLEFFFFEKCAITTKIPYLVTLHGSYEAAEITSKRLTRLARGVTHFVYTADKNFELFKSLRLPPRTFSKLPNAAPLDSRPFPKTRQELDIPPDAVVFTLVSRGIPRKGWSTAIAALRRLRELHPAQEVHLLLCGEGGETDRLATLHGDDPNITFLGYQSRIHGLYRMSDVAILPTRFSGESFPFCIVEAIQTGTPVIATRLGEIPSMLELAGMAPAGILIDADEDSEAFAQQLAAAMDVMLVPDRRSLYATAAAERATAYSMDNLLQKYLDLYASILSEAQT